MKFGSELRLEGKERVRKLERTADRTRRGLMVRERTRECVNNEDGRQN